MITCTYDVTLGISHNGCRDPTLLDTYRQDKYARHIGMRELSVGLCRGIFLAFRASVWMLATSSGASFRASLSVPTDECMGYYYAVFACDGLLVCACPVHVDFLSAAVDALAVCC
jgi:hypothetical protein